MSLDLLNPYALLNGRIISINEINNFDYNFICPHCKEKLIPKVNGKIKRKHFSHYGKSCGNSFETAIHFQAKEIFSKYSSLNLPKYPGQFNCSVKSTPRNFNNIFNIHFNEFVLPGANQSGFNSFLYSDVFIESSIGIIRPDVILFGKEPVIIEVYVSHKTSDDKIKYINKELGLYAIEIDLRLLRRLEIIDHTILKNAVIGCAHLKEWISCW